MKFMLIRKADDQTEQGVMPSEGLLQAMVDYNERMVKAGVFVTGDGLKPSSDGYRIEFTHGRPQVIAGPFTEPAGLVAGYTVLEVGSPEEAIEWARQWPVEDSDGNVRLELRRYFELDDFAPGAAIDKHRELCDQLSRRPTAVCSHVTFSGNCREAMAFYAELMGGEVRAMLAFSDTPMAEEVPESFRDRICHAELVIGSYTVMGADTMAADIIEDGYQAPAGHDLCLQFDDVAQGEQIFQALAQGGTVRMPFEETFWAQGFGMVVDRFGVGWMINCGIKTSADCPSQ
ncbi:YciI family protein [Marinobacter zhejiangensis]|uniref:Uncharacterized conserved protein PhnB, glyoxalase superfamily n=1 Tax=Marinobacter zhejiangensis TaxID=488535 RepID=A0A1I4LKJ4_9GAMM|nr:YciI family protein [Marinobacter zhejiangensis]SFL91618.1 Uncharacterized conserved protein PhnB, glyoxalase superfamily [Marinobacter zhejiangensis]